MSGLAPVVLSVAAALSGCTGVGDQAPAARYEPMFQEEFDAILARLVDEFWSVDGDWGGDMQGDATAFAPAVLYALAAERSDSQWAHMATATVDHELALVRTMVDTGELSMDAIIGAPALADGYRHTADESYQFTFLVGTAAGYDMISTEPEQFLPFVFDIATVYGTGATMCFLAHELSAQAQFRHDGLDLVERANTETWNQAAGMYDWSQVMDWPQATMMMALAAAHQATGDSGHLSRALQVLGTMDDCCWDEPHGGYFGHGSGHTKGLSGNNNMAWALLDLFDRTGDRRYLAKAQQVLEWILSADLYAPEQRLIFHHWTADGGSDPGRADTFCTGCNFQTLRNIQRFNERAEQLAHE